MSYNLLQAESAPPEALARPKKDEKEGAPERPVRSAIPVKPLERGATDKGRRIVERAIPVDDRYRRGGSLSMAPSDGKRPVLAKVVGDIDPKDRLGRRVAGADKPSPLQSQVLYAFFPAFLSPLTCASRAKLRHVLLGLHTTPWGTPWGNLQTPHLLA